MQTYKRNEVEDGSSKVIGNQGFAWQQNEMKQSQQLSPSFLQSVNRSQSFQDENQETDTQVEEKKFSSDNSINEGLAQEGDEQQIKKQNKSLFHTLNNSMDKLFCNDNFQSGQDISKYVIFKDFQSDSKFNSKYGSKKESKQQTPKCTPRFNFHGLESLNLQQISAPLLQKQNKNNSNYQSQESFCFKEGRNIEFIIPNSQTCTQSTNQAIYENNLYGQNSQQINMKNAKNEYENQEYNEYSPYMIYQKSYGNEIENQQQLNSYHLPQKKKKNHNNNTLNAANLEQNNFYHQLNSDFQNNANKQASMMIMMSQVQTHQKQYRLNKQQTAKTAKNNDIQLNYSQSNGRVCQTEPSYDDYCQEPEIMNNFKNSKYNLENGIKFYQQNEIGKPNGKPIFVKNDNQLSDTNNNREFRNSQLTKRPINDTKNSKQVFVDERNNDYDQIREDSMNEEEESYEVDYNRQNAIEDLIKYQQNGQQFANNLKHNNFINQKLYQNQISRVRQQVMLQQQNNAKHMQKINTSDSKQNDLQSKSIRRTNTNPNGIASNQQNPIRIGSGDSRKGNQLSINKNIQLFGDQNKVFINGKSNVTNSETTNFNHNQRKFRQFSAHTSSSNNNQFLADKNNHIIDEDYNSNNESFININNIPQYQDSINDDQGKYQALKNGFGQQNNNKQEQQIQSMTQQQNQVKRQLNFKQIQDDQNTSFNLEKQIINKKIQDFEKKRNVNLNSLQQQLQNQNLQPVVASSSSQSSGNSSKIVNQQQNIMMTTPSQSQVSAYNNQQHKRNQSASKKKKSKSKSPAQRGLDSILEVSQKFEVGTLNQQKIKESLEKTKQVLNEQKKQSLIQELDSVNQNETQQESLKKGDTQQMDYNKVICKTEGNESDSSLKINFDESDANQLARIEQDQQLLSTNQSSTYKIANHENSLNYVRSANSKQFQKMHKRIQSANKTTSNIQNNFLMHPQLNLALNHNQTLQSVSSNQYFMQTQNNIHRGRFNSYQNNNNSNQLNLQQVQKKLNIQTTTNNTISAQQNSLTNTLLKNQLKKRSFTPSATTNHYNLNQIQFQNSIFKDSFFNDQQNQNGSRNNIKKITRNQKNFSMAPQPEKEQQPALSQNGASMQNQVPQYQQLSLNPPQHLQIQPQTFPNLQKQQIKRNEIALSNNQQNSSQQQQPQQLPVQRPSSRSIQSQNNGVQQSAQKQKQMINQNLNGIVSNSNNNQNQLNLYNKLNKI